MTKKIYNIYMAFIGPICIYVIVRHIYFFFIDNSKPFMTDVIQGILVGFGLAIASAFITSKIKSTKVNGWRTMFGCGAPSNGMLLRAACALAFPGPINIPQEAMYWTASVDGANRDLSGEHDYILRFPADGLPPNSAFWSLTMGDAKNRFVANPINRYSVSDRTGLVSNDDGSVDIYIQNTAPVGWESNWLPAPLGEFILWLRVYMPDEAILDGKYNVTPVMEVK